MCAEQSYQSPRERVATGERLFVGEDEGLVAGVEVDALERAVVVQVDAAGLHELQRPFDLVGDDLVALALEGVGDELLVPRVHPRERGEAAGREGAQQVERRDALVVGGEQALGVGSARGGVELLVVDDVAAESESGATPSRSSYCVGAGLGELAGDASDLDDRHARA